MKMDITLRYEFGCSIVLPMVINSVSIPSFFMKLDVAREEVQAG